MDHCTISETMCNGHKQLSDYISQSVVVCNYKHNFLILTHWTQSTWHVISRASVDSLSGSTLQSEHWNSETIGWTSAKLMVPEKSD
jgi:hypothetical protein